MQLRRADVQRIGTEPSRITEGIFLWWCGPLAERAALIVWLYISWRVAALRIIRRHMMRSLAGTNRHRGMQNLVRFIRTTRHYYLDDPHGELVFTDENDDCDHTRGHARLADALQSESGQVSNRAGHPCRRDQHARFRCMHPTKATRTFRTELSTGSRTARMLLVPW